MTSTEAPGVAETRHRMANNQQLLASLARLRAQRSGDGEAARALNWMADSIGLLGVLERRRAEGGVDFAGLLEEMVPVWRRRFGGGTEVALEAEPLVAPDGVAPALALIAQELTANALMHGRPADGAGRVEIRLARQGAGYELTVIDDGPNPGEPADGFGLWLVRNLAQQVRGRLELAAGEGGQGFVARLQAPL